MNTFAFVGDLDASPEVRAGRGRAGGAEEGLLLMRTACFRKLRWAGALEEALSRG